MALGKEDLIHKKLAAVLRQYEGYNQLKCNWWSYDASGEKRSAVTGSLLKAKGLRPGSADYCFRVVKKNIAHYIHIEIKIPKIKGKQREGEQSDHQLAFEELCYACNEEYYIARSVEEALDILRYEGILIN